MSEVQYECSMCGLQGGPNAGCNICKGSERFRQITTGHTLSDYRSGRAEQPVRHGLDGNVAPKHKDPLWVGADIENH